MKIALVSLNQYWEDKKSNLVLCEKYIENASKKSVDLIIFPEMTLTGFSNNIDLTSENFENSETIEKFSNLAKEFNISVIFGVVIKDNKKALNKSIFIDNFGNILGNYSKVHPFSFSGEDRYFNAGNKISIVKYKDLKIGLTICYDLRFPELYSSLAKDCDLIINIANWPSKRVDHWNTLLKARAIENQIFMVGVNRTGIDGNGLEYIESSNIFNANGEKLEFEKYEDMKIYDVDVKFTKDFKNKFNTVNDRKVEFYKEIL
ncbi:nitrilase-related carbon-nitrogen hydrolase [Aliarcobacter lanthieri]|uniref:nitrilase-related carbon-nitrogen hydrolase n=1 Tax=Aliarcobacter lanthieri TaxID=1355374 RepID=UPI003AAE9334